MKTRTHLLLLFPNILQILGPVYLANIWLIFWVLNDSCWSRHPLSKNATFSGILCFVKAQNTFLTRDYIYCFSSCCMNDCTNVITTFWIVPITSQLFMPTIYAFDNTFFRGKVSVCLSVCPSSVGERKGKELTVQP